MRSPSAPIEQSQPQIRMNRYMGINEEASEADKCSLLHLEGYSGGGRELIRSARRMGRRLPRRSETAECGWIAACVIVVLVVLAFLAALWWPTVAMSNAENGVAAGITTRSWTMARW